MCDGCATSASTPSSTSRSALRRSALSREAPCRGRSRAAPVEVRAQVLAEEVDDALVLGGDRARGVGADEDVRQVPERAVGRQRLLLEDVERRTAQPARAQRLDERCLLDDVAAGDVDERSAPGLSSASRRASSRRCVSGVCGVASTTTSAWGSTSSSASVEASSSTPAASAVRSPTSRTMPTTRASSARASRATSRPIFPSPTTQTTLPRTSSPACRSQRCSRWSREQWQRLLAEHQHPEQRELGERPGVHAARGRHHDVRLEQPDPLHEAPDPGARALDPPKLRPRGERRGELQRPEVEEDLRRVEQLLPARRVGRRKRMVGRVARRGQQLVGVGDVERRVDCADAPDELVLERGRDRRAGGSCRRRA